MKESDNRLVIEGQGTCKAETRIDVSTRAKHSLPPRGKCLVSVGVSRSFPYMFSASFYADCRLSMHLMAQFKVLSKRCRAIAV